MKIKDIKIKNKNDYGSNFIPPDGGFGWLICCASGISNMWMFCIFQNFGLIYQEKFMKLDLTNAEITAIPNTQTAIAYFVGFLTGPLLKRFTYRQIGLFGSLCFSLGVFLMSYANSFITCLISYGFFVGSGAGLCFPSSALAINTYFKKKRRIAHTISWTITGFGQIFMPTLIIWLLIEFNEIETSKIISALCFHMFACNLLYQPVLWHVNNLKEQDTLKLESQLIDNDDAFITIQESNEKQNGVLDYCKLSEETLWHKVVIYFDLDFLRNPTFVNIEIGMIFPYLAELNFGILTPIFLNEFGFEQDQIVIIMTLSTISDIAGRLILPLILVKTKIESRFFYLLGIFGQLISILMVAIFGQNIGYCKLIVISYVIFGLFRGLKTVYMQLILPEFVPLDRLSGANGLNNLLTGFFALTIGSQIGVIKDEMNYVWLLYFLGVLLFIPIISWVIEFAYKYLKSRN